jgi:hypothetical protein
MLNEKDIPTVTEDPNERIQKKGGYANGDSRWAVSGIYTLPEDGFADEKVEVKAGDVFVEFWRVEDRYERGNKEGFIKSIERCYVHVLTGTHCESVTTDHKTVKSTWTSPKTGETIVFDDKVFRTVFNCSNTSRNKETKRAYNKRMNLSDKVQCECGCQQAVDNCDQEFGRFEG